jgi:hypothetical protein
MMSVPEKWAADRIVDLSDKAPKVRHFFGRESELLFEVGVFHVGQSELQLGELLLIGGELGLEDLPLRGPCSRIYF